MADVGGGGHLGGGDSGGDSGSTNNSSSSGAAELNTTIESTANTQLINEVASIGGGVQSTERVGWNAVPSGFEPLTRIIGGNKKAYQISDFSGGLNEKTSPRDLSLSECTEANNVCFSDMGKIVNSGGFSEYPETGVHPDIALWSLQTGDRVIPAQGYGAFTFKSAYSFDATPKRGNYHCIGKAGTVNGDNVYFYDGSQTSTFNHLATGITNDYWHGFCPVFYAQGKSVFVGDANFLNLKNRPVVMTMVDRNDINNGTVPIRQWVAYDKPLINSPGIAATDADTASTADNGGIVTDHIDAAYNVANAGRANGQVTVFIVDNGTGGWGSGGSDTFTFYASWLFDGINETALSTINGTAMSCAETKVDCNIAINHTAANPAGGNIRINGMRIYYSKSSENDAKKYFLMEASWEEGVKRSTDSVFTPWVDSGTNNANGDDIYDLSADMTIDNPPDLLEYVDLNGYFEDEVYDTAGNTSNIGAYKVKYKTATVGADGRVYIGNVAFNASTSAYNKIPSSPDVMMFSAPGRPGCFPKFNTYEAPTNDGGAIMALESFGDKVLQFRQDSVTIVNVSRPKFFVEKSFGEIGVSNPCQVTRLPFGVAWVNESGCYLYDGKTVTSLTHGKFNKGMWDTTSIDSWDIEATSVVAAYEKDRGTDPSGNAAVTTNGQAAKTPSIGYDPISKRLVIAKNIARNNSSDVGSGFLYDFMTQSWSRSAESLYQVTLTDSTQRWVSNYVNYKGLLGHYKANNKFSFYKSRWKESPIAINYTTKDIDFGAPAIRKKIYKVYVTYRGGASNSVTVTYGVDGNTPSHAFDGSGVGVSADGILDSTSTTGVRRVTLTPDASSTSTNNRYSFQLRFSGNAAAGFYIEDITIIYRMKKVK